MKFTPEHIGYAAVDPAAVKDWYVKMLNGKLMFTTDDQPPAFFVQLDGGLVLEIYKATSTSELTTNNNLAGWRHLALQVESLEEAQAELEKKGVRFTEPIKPAGGGGRVRYFRDVADNLLHLVERPKDSQFKI
jgi:catechol 2,3-dioxygenase-like lactoylglutathione lyase family enzyme